MKRIDVAELLAVARNEGHVRVAILDSERNQTDAVLLYVLWERATDTIVLEIQSEEDNLAMQKREAEEC